jgi:Zn-dependent protease
VSASILRTVYEASIFVIPVVIAITFHEAAHGFVAWQLGDDTAYRAGRVTFNPIRHIDLYGTILLPAILLLLRVPFLFGYAKPVPVNFGRLREPRRDMVWVALAGPGINIALAFLAGLMGHLLPFLPAAAANWLAQNLQIAIAINLVLALFNMIPLPPLDGGRVAVGLLPRALAIPLARTERYGIMILIVVLVLVPLAGSHFGLDLNIFRWLLGPPIEFLYHWILILTGN